MDVIKKMMTMMPMTVTPVVTDQTAQDFKTITRTTTTAPPPPRKVKFFVFFWGGGGGRKKKR